MDPYPSRPMPVYFTENGEVSVTNMTNIFYTFKPQISCLWTPNGTALLCLGVGRIRFAGEGGRSKLTRVYYSPYANKTVLSRPELRDQELYPKTEIINKTTVRLSCPEDSNQIERHILVTGGKGEVQMGIDQAKGIIPNIQIPPGKWEKEVSLDDLDSGYPLLMTKDEMEGRELKTRAVILPGNDNRRPLEEAVTRRADENITRRADEDLMTIYVKLDEDAPHVKPPTRPDTILATKKSVGSAFTDDDDGPGVEEDDGPGVEEEEEDDGPGMTDQSSTEEDRSPTVPSHTLTYALDPATKLFKPDPKGTYI